VWASGSQFHFLLNDVEVISIRNDELKTGGFGLFVRARESQQTTVSFDYILLHDIEANPTPTENSEDNTIQ
jgi:hypothetical protein